MAEQGTGPAKEATAAAIDAEAEKKKRGVALDELSNRLDAKKIDLREYNLRRKLILEGRLDALDAPLESLPAGSLAPKAAWSDDAPKRWASKQGRGDDPSARQVHQPTASGIGNGKSFLFLFGLKRTREIDQKMLEKELAGIGDDIEVLCKAGYTVVVDPQSTKEDFLDAIYGKGEGVVGLAPAGILWSAHGYPDGAIETCDGGTIRLKDIDSAAVSPALRLMIFSACYVGSRSQVWRDALGGKPLVVGWGEPVTSERAVDFLTPSEETQTDLDDLIKRYLLADTPLPASVAAGREVLEKPRGRVEDMLERVQRVVAPLAAEWRQADGAIEVRVPLREGRLQVVETFVVDSGKPFNEGEPLLAVQTVIGEISAVVDPVLLLAGSSAPGYARVAVVKSQTDMPNMVVQGFLPLTRVRDRDLGALIHEVASLGDELEKRVFGIDRS